jgi:CubicO group peptidase (beta-lactamase class C family)
VDGDKSEVAVFGKLGDAKAADGEAVYKIGPVTDIATARLLAELVLSGRAVTLDTPVAQLLPDFKIPSRHSATGTVVCSGCRPGLPAAETGPTSYSGLKLAVRGLQRRSRAHRHLLGHSSDFITIS